MPREVSLPALRGMLAQETGEVYLTRLTIDHASLSEPLRFVNDGQTMVVGNLLERSEAFDHAYWTAAGASVTPDVATAPDGEATADELVEDDTNGAHAVYRDHAALANDTAYVFSVHARANARGWISLQFTSKDGATHRAWFDIANGAKGSSDAGIIDYGIQAAGEDFYRCFIVANNATGGTTPRTAVALATADGIATYTGDDDSSAYLWGAALLAARYPHGYVRTTDAAVTPVLWIAAPFHITLPQDRDDELPHVQLTIDNITPDIIAAIRSLTSAPTITMDVVLARTPATIEAGPFEMTLRGVSYDAFTITGQLGFEDILNEPFPALAFTPRLFPGIFA